jgi:hypothetical protein
VAVSILLLAVVDTDVCMCAKVRGSTEGHRMLGRPPEITSPRHRDARKKRRPVKSAMILLLVVAGSALGTGCGASVSVSGGTISNDGPYRALWAKSWKRISTGLIPYRATATSPGVCNAGGDMRACWTADFGSSADFQEFRKGLQHVHVPGPYKHATQLMLVAISDELNGLDLRMRSLHPGPATSAERDAWFRHANQDLLAAERGFAQANAAFPDWARPSPSPSS